MIQSREKGLCWDLFTGNNQDTKKQKEEICKIVRRKILTVPDKSKTCRETSWSCILCDVIIMTSKKGLPEKEELK